jgi:hypothetical protein
VLTGVAPAAGVVLQGGVNPVKLPKVTAGLNVNTTVTLDTTAELLFVSFTE